VKLTVERLPASQVRLDIVAEEAEFAAAVEKAARKVARDVQMPGFRKGKVPRSMIERMYGREVFLEEAHKLIMDDLYRQALTQEELVPVGAPEVDITEPDPIAFSVVVSVYPTVDPGDYAAIRVDPGDAAVEESEIAEVIDRLQKTSSPWVDPADPRKPREGDQITLDLAMATEEGEPFQEPVEDAVFVIGESQLFPQLAEVVQTLDVGEGGTTTITFAEDDQDATERLRGQTLVYTVTLKGLKERELLEVDDDFASSYAGEPTVDALHVAITRDLHQGKTTEVRKGVVNSITDQIAGQATAEVPSEMVDEALDEELNRVRQRLQMQRTSLESYLRAQDQTEEELREELRPSVAKRLRNSLILRAIAEKEGVEVTDEDVDAEVETIVAGTPNEEQLRKVYGGDRYMRTVLRNELFDQRLTDRLIELATEGRGAVLNAFDAGLYPTPEPAAVAPSADEDAAAPIGEGDDTGAQLGLVAADSAGSDDPMAELAVTDGSDGPMEELATIAAADDEPMEDDLPDTDAELTAGAAADEATAGREAEADQLALGSATGGAVDLAADTGLGTETGSDADEPTDGTTPFPGSVAATGDTCPDDHPIKGNASSKIYHQLGQSSYASTIPEICFATAEDAKAAGFRASKSSGSVE